MAELIVSPLLRVIFGNLTSAAMEELRLVWGVDKELNNLKSTMSAILAVLEDAEGRQVESNAVKDWLGKLQDVAYEADDLVDEIATEAQQSMVESRTEAGKRMKQQVCDFVLSCFGCTRVGYRREMAHRIREINEQLDKIAKQKADLGLQVRSGNMQIETREPRQLVSSVKDESEVFGREDDRKQIIESLLSDDYGNRRKFSVIAIVGMGGQGKTTLAQTVYNDERVKRKFELRAWVCVAENFDVKRLTKEIIESAGGSPCHLSSIDALQSCLRDKLNGKKFLLVLDDVWNETPGKWEGLQVPFAFGAKGSKIVVTTRSRAVSGVMQPTHTYQLKGLSEEDCLSLFESRVFVDDEDVSTYPHLVKIGKKLVEKCQGLPLAVKALGGLLSSTREAREWENILNSATWHQRGEAEGILPSLRLSYQHLPVHLKRCFSFCSIYPKDRRFVVEELVWMWIAHGFIRAEDGEQIEDTGSRYFNDLVQRSFFQYSSSLDWCTMHDLFHDLAQSISGKECFYMDGFGPNGVPQKTRHLSLKLISGEEHANFETLYESRGLRTLLLLKSDWTTNYKVPHQMFDRLRFIKMLELVNCDVPASIGNLSHLRYLKLENCSIKELPESICSIYSLQALILSQCNNLVKLPDSIGNLKHLRHLKLEGCSIITELPASVCSIYNLQTLISPYALSLLSSRMRRAS